MDYGTENELNVCNSLRKSRHIVALFEVGLIASKNAEDTHLAASSDGIAFVNTPDGEVVMATVTINTKVVETHYRSASVTAERYGDFFMCECGSDMWFNSVSTAQHRAQVLHQAMVLDLDYALFVVAQPTNLCYAALIHISPEQRNTYRQYLRPYKHLVSWIHTRGPNPPAGLTDKQAQIVDSHLKLWRAERQHVVTNGLQRPARVLKTAVATFYSLCKEGVDKHTQARVQFRDSHLHLKWRQSVVVNALLSIATNAITAARICRTFFDLESFVGLDSFRKPAFNMLPYCSGILDIVMGLVRHASLQRCEARQRQLSAVPRQRVRIPKRNRRAFWASVDGKRIRLSNDHHQPIVQTTNATCPLCKCRSPQYKCAVCDTPLCMRRKNGAAAEAQTCWNLFHTSETL
mgnify:CR=1 FL=1